MSKPAWEIWKDIAYPGRVVVPGEDGALVYDFTARDMQLLERSGNEKVRDGWSIPIAWEHQDVEPERLRLSRNRDRDFARGVFGSIRRFARTPDGRVKALLAGDDPEDFRQLKKVQFVSPEIQWDWVDTDGRTWAGPSVTHLAATPRPVQRHQHPIGSNPDAPHPRLSQAKSFGQLLRMSLTKGLCVGAKLRLSLDHYTRPPAGNTAMADENKTVPGLPSDKPSAWKRIAMALEKAGIKIGDGENIKDPDHLADLIEVAAMNSEQANDLEDDVPDLEDEDEDPNPSPGDMDQPPEGASVPPGQPIQMSLAANNELIAMHRKDLVTRAERLGRKGYVTPALSNQIVAEVKRVKLSLTANAKLADAPVIAKIAAYEALEPGKAWSKTGRIDPATGKGKTGKVRMSQNGNRKQEVDRSPYQEDGEQDTDAAVDAWEKNVGRG